MQRQSQVILGIFVLGIIFVGLSFYFSRGSSSSSISPSIKLGTLIKETGSIEILKEGLKQRTKIESKSDVHNFDSIESSEIGEGTLTLENGYRLRVFGSSLLTLEQINEVDNLRILITIKRGDLRVDQVGRANELVIAKNGIQVVAENYNDSDLQSKPTKPNKEGLVNPDKIILSEEEIAITMANHKNSFYKCYSRLLMKQNAAKGAVSLTFLIDNSGSISDLNIQTQLNDDEFKRCLRDVVGRIQFKPYKGPQISAFFPLKFD
jgi:hypothetical protein